ncbi:20191_t:CDS:1, partial [Cetraspora pellucida]
DLVLQERDNIIFEFSFNTSETSIKENDNMNFNPEDLFDSVLNIKLD